MFYFKPVYAYVHELVVLSGLQGMELEHPRPQSWQVVDWSGDHVANDQMSGHG